ERPGGVEQAEHPLLAGVVGVHAPRDGELGQGEVHEGHVVVEQPVAVEGGDGGDHAAPPSLAAGAGVTGASILPTPRPSNPRNRRSRRTSAWAPGRPEPARLSERARAPTSQASMAAWYWRSTRALTRASGVVTADIQDSFAGVGVRRHWRAGP